MLHSDHEVHHPQEHHHLTLKNCYHTKISVLLPGEWVHHTVLCFHGEEAVQSPSSSTWHPCRWCQTGGAPKMSVILSYISILNLKALFGNYTSLTGVPRCAPASPSPGTSRASCPWWWWGTPAQTWYWSSISCRLFRTFLFTGLWTSGLQRCKLRTRACVSIHVIHITISV